MSTRCHSPPLRTNSHQTAARVSISIDSRTEKSLISHCLVPSQWDQPRLAKFPSHAMRQMLNCSLPRKLAQVSFNPARSRFVSLRLLNTDCLSVMTRTERPVLCAFEYVVLRLSSPTTTPYTYWGTNKEAARDPAPRYSVCCSRLHNCRSLPMPPPRWHADDRPDAPGHCHGRLVVRAARCRRSGVSISDHEIGNEDCADRRGSCGLGRAAD